MAPPSSGAYILITDGAPRMTRAVTATLLDSKVWIQKGETWRQNQNALSPPPPHTFYFPEKMFGTSWGSSQMPSHKDPSSQINVISTNGDEITHTRDPSRRPDCHPPRQRRKHTEIIKSHSGGSMAAHKFCSCHFRGRLSLPLFCSFLQ